MDSLQANFSLDRRLAASAVELRAPATEPSCAEQARWLREAFESTPTGLGYVSLSGRILHANRKLCALLGREAAELATLSVGNITHPDDLALDLEYVGRLLAGEIDRYTLAKRFVRPDGTVVPARLTVALVRDAAGSGVLGAPLHFVSIVEPLLAQAVDVLGRTAEGFVALDRDFRITRINAEGLALDGRAEHEIVGHTLWDIWQGLRGTMVEAACRRAMAERVPVEFEHHYRSERNDRWLELRAYPTDEGLAAFFHDITPRKTVERRQAFALALNERLRDLADPQALMDAAARTLGEYLQVAQVGYGEVDEAQVHVTVHRDWNDGRIGSVVGTWCMDDFGLRMIDEMKAGQTVAIDDVTQDARTSAPAVLAAYAAIGTRSLLDVPLIKGARLRAMLFIHHCEPRSWTAADVSMVEETCERLWAAVERARMARALAASEAHLRAVLDALPVGVVIADAAGHVVQDNAAHRELWGVPPDTTSWEQYGDWVGWWPDTGERIQAHEWAMARALLHGTVTRGELVECQPFGGGPRRFYLNNAAAVRDAAGRVVGGVVAELDVTEQRAAAEALAASEAALREVDRRKDEFLAMLAHELRNPLAPLTYALRLVERTEPLTERGRGALNMATRQTRQLTHLVDDLLEVSRITRGRIELKRARISVGSAVQQAVEAIGADSAARDHRVELDLPAQPLWTEADPVRIAQMLGNLLGNACKYTPNGGRIAVRAAEQGEMVEIRVADNGIGVDPAKLPRLFELFHQVDATLDRNRLGNLTFTHRIQLQAGILTQCQ